MEDAGLTNRYSEEESLALQFSLACNLLVETTVLGQFREIGIRGVPRIGVFGITNGGGRWLNYTFLHFVMVICVQCLEL